MVEERVEDERGREERRIMKGEGREEDRHAHPSPDAVAM